MSAGRSLRPGRLVPGRRPGAGEWAPHFELVVLVSGHGSNLQALIDAGCPIAAVAGDVPEAPAFSRAEAAGIPTRRFDPHGYASRAEFDDALAEGVEASTASGRADLVVLAGFMRILGPAFVARFEGRLINIHPSLLPAFPGLRTHERALASGAREHGCTVHFVTEEVDGGPVIARSRVPVQTGDTPDSLAARVLAEEHRLLPEVVLAFAEGRVELRDGLVHFDREPARGLETSGPAIRATFENPPG